MSVGTKGTLDADSRGQSDTDAIRCRVETLEVHAIDNQPTGIVIMPVFGVPGFLVEENGIPIALAVLGLVFGPMLEQNFVTSVIKPRGGSAALLERSIAAGLGAFTLVIRSTPLFMVPERRKAASPP